MTWTQNSNRVNHLWNEANWCLKHCDILLNFYVWKFLFFAALVFNRRHFKITPVRYIYINILIGISEYKNIHRKRFLNALLSRRVNYLGSNKSFFSRMLKVISGELKKNDENFIHKTSIKRFFLCAAATAQNLILLYPIYAIPRQIFYSAC